VKTSTTTTTSKPSKNHHEVLQINTAMNKPTLEKGRERQVVARLLQMLLISNQAIVLKCLKTFLFVL
jgi:hypothetical protein